MRKIQLVNRFKISPDDFNKLHGTPLMENLVRYKFYLGAISDKNRRDNAICRNDDEYKDIDKWCEQNCTDLYYFEESNLQLTVIRFASGKDAMKFKLTFDI